MRNRQATSQNPEHHFRGCGFDAQRRIRAHASLPSVQILGRVFSTDLGQMYGGPFHISGGSLLHRRELPWIAVEGYHGVNIYGRGRLVSRSKDTELRIVSGTVIDPITPRERAVRATDGYPATGTQRAVFAALTNPDQRLDPAILRNLGITPPLPPRNKLCSASNPGEYHRFLQMRSRIRRPSRRIQPAHVVPYIVPCAGESSHKTLQFPRFCERSEDRMPRRTSQA